MSICDVGELCLRSQEVQRLLCSLQFCSLCFLFTHVLYLHHFCITGYFNSCLFVNFACHTQMCFLVVTLCIYTPVLSFGLLWMHSFSHNSLIASIYFCKCIYLFLSYLVSPAATFVFEQRLVQIMD